ncbi:MAG: RNA ligase family protein [Myxococcota bacterium]
MSPQPFPKIPYYRGEADPLHLIDRVVCMEKIDGTNTRIGVPVDAQSMDDILIGGRTRMASDPGFNQSFLVDLFRNNHDLCQRMVDWTAAAGRPLTIYGEVCGARIQKMGLIYGARPHFLLFAARLGEAWLGWSRAVPPPPRQDPIPTLKQLSAQLQLPMAPILYEGPPQNTVFDDLREQTSQHSLDQGFSRPGVDQTHEGIVIWSDPVLRDPWGTPLVAKHKPDRRREYHPPRESDRSPQDFAKRAVTEERLLHARQHLEERGRWTGSPDRDHPALVKRVIQDVSREVDEYQDQLRAHGKQAVRAALKARARELLSTPLSP